jgi:hypothetical protein
VRSTSKVSETIQAFFTQISLQDEGQNLQQLMPDNVAAAAQLAAPALTASP